MVIDSGLRRHRPAWSELDPDVTANTWLAAQAAVEVLLRPLIILLITVYLSCNLRLGFYLLRALTVESIFQILYMLTIRGVALTGKMLAVHESCWGATQGGPESSATTISPDSPTYCFAIEDMIPLGNRGAEPDLRNTRPSSDFVQGLLSQENGQRTDTFSQPALVLRQLVFPFHCTA